MYLTLTGPITAVIPRFPRNFTEVGIEDGIFTKPIKEAWNEYADSRLCVYGEKTDRPVTLMDMATVA